MRKISFWIALMASMPMLLPEVFMIPMAVAARRPRRIWNGILLPAS